MQDIPKNRVISILRQHALLFGDGIVCLDPRVRAEAAELAAALQDPSEAQALRIASILRQHALLFGRGTVLDIEETVSEDQWLLDALARKTPGTVPPDAASAVRSSSRSGGKLPDAAHGSPEDLHRGYRLFGEGRRKEIDEKSGMVALWCRNSVSHGAAVLFVPLEGVDRRVLEPEPVQLWLSGPIHVLLIDPFDAVRRALGHGEWPPDLDGPPDPDSMLTIRTDGGDRICLGMRPMSLKGARHVVAAVEMGIYPYFFPEYGGMMERLSGFLAQVLRAHIGTSRSDAAGVADFAVRRILRGA